ncbi:hypothetical protein [Spirosoma pollinicola]|uniref:Alpha/beta hydrolase n=1 Tax=Spirosoma pollinicola TaxID=2057025 RepID=A0A2K8Z4R8_9BACT|nr:hypothetical protein [Spirosoma pollinicola]AUD04873.1 hypothetical protein CWM47_25330 [Spirosoma pollinicola]
MPLIYVHGVAVRDENAWKEKEPYLRRYITQEINPDDPDNVDIFPVFWGDDGVKFAWDGESRPRTALLGQGFDTEPTPAERAVLLASLGNSLGKLPASPSVVETAPEDELLAAGPATPVVSTTKPQRLRDLTNDQLSDLLAAMLMQQGANPVQQSRMIIAADDVARDPATRASLQACATTAEEVSLLQSLIKQRYDQLAPTDDPLLGMGAGWFPNLKDRLNELLTRANQTPGFVVSRLLGEFRPVVNSAVTLFIGDVFVYLANRLAKPVAILPEAEPAELQPGTIPMQFLNALNQAYTSQQQAEAKGRFEPIVVLTHSMGGQIVYDAVTTFLPQVALYQKMRVDFWCATASQVGLFEEMKLFLASSSAYSKAKMNKVPFPDRRYLGDWWNVWDANDILSFTGESIFEDVDDEFYDSGSSTLDAHGGYLERPSFYRTFADKLRTARAINWHQP